MHSLLLFIIYLSFISLGLPDSLLGSAWPTIYQELQVPISYSGLLSMTIALCTVISSLCGDRLTATFGTGRVTAGSVGLTAAAILGFSFSTQFWQLFLWAIPYGLGAGSVDAALNNYVALHYESKHMSWLHCMWGIGTIIGPFTIGYSLTGGYGWSGGYRIVGIAQVVLTALLLLSLPLWKEHGTGGEAETEELQENRKLLSLPEIIRLPGAKEVMVAFFCYSALEQTGMLWAGSYLTIQNGIPAEEAASLASMFFIGITVGRAANGFLAMHFLDIWMIRGGQALIGLGVFVMLFFHSNSMTLFGLILVGLGCAPIYPCIIHSTPQHFGADKSQALIGIQMASAYTGTSLMPPLFGALANRFGMSLMPFYLLGLLLLMIATHETLIRKTENGKQL